MSSDAVNLSCRPFSRHAPSRSLSARCSATRADFLGLAGRTGIRSSFLRTLARRRSWVFQPPFAGLFPRMSELLHLWRSGPRVASHAAHPPRLIFVGVTHRPYRKVSKSGEPGMNRGVRLLGFDSHLRSASRSSHEPKDRSCLGLCLLQGLPDACLRTRLSSKINHVISPRNPTARNFRCVSRNSNPLVGFPVTAHRIPSAY
jgi:hypothetical protein